MDTVRAGWLEPPSWLLTFFTCRPVFYNSSNIKNRGWKATVFISRYNMLLFNYHFFVLYLIAILHLQHIHPGSQVLQVQLF